MPKRLNINDSEKSVTLNNMKKSYFNDVGWAKDANEARFIIRF